MNEQPLVKELSAGGSAYRRYLAMFVGRDSVWALIRYEIIAAYIGVIPGALGYLLRRRFFPKLLARVGRNCMFGRSIVLRSPGRIELGRGVVIDDLAVLDAKGETSAIELGNEILIGRGSVFSCNEATIRTGDFLSIGPYCIIASRSSIEVGSNVSMGAGTQLMAGGHAFDDPEVPVIRQRRLSAGIIIEDNVWIGAGTVVMDGAIIRENSIIGAGAVVKGEIPANSVAVGVPARVLYDRIERAGTHAMQGVG